MLVEGRSLAKEVPPPGYEITTFAQVLARVDLPGALEMIEKSKDSARRGDRVNRVFVFDRCYGEVAYRVASEDSAGTERVLGMIVDSHRRAGYVVAACARWRPRSAGCAAPRGDHRRPDYSSLCAGRHGPSSGRG